MLDATGEFLSIRLAATDLQGNPITQVAQGEAFLIKAYADDRRDEAYFDDYDFPEDVTPDAIGFFTAYFNVTYDAAGFDFDPTYGDEGIKFGPGLAPVYEPFAPNTQYDGYIERLGVTNQYTVDIPGEIEILSFRMIAETPDVYDMAEAFIPHFHFEQAVINEDPNESNPDNWVPYYVDGVPVLERLTGAAFNEAVDDNDEYFLLHQFDTQILTEDDEVYFQGVDLEVIASADANFDLRFVSSPTTLTSGEVNSRPSNVDVIDEWSHFYVEVYAQAPSDSAIQAGFVELNYDAEDFNFVRAIDSTQDSSIRYSITSTEVDEENGTIRVGYTSQSTTTGDDRYALLGRIQMKSEMELPVDYTNGELTFTMSSDITLSDTSATIYKTSSGTSAVISGTATATHSFEVWPVIYDVGAAGEDRKVGINDFAGFISEYGKVVNNDPELRKFDFNNNGKIDLIDFSLFIQNYNESDLVPSTRKYPDGYPGDLGGVPLMGSQFILEGEQVDSRSSSPATNTPTNSPSQVTIEPEPTSVADDSLSSTFPFSPVAATDSSGDGDNQTNPDVSPAEETTDAVISTLDDQTDLIVMTSQESEESFATEEDESDFTEHADQVLAIWEDEADL